MLTVAMEAPASFSIAASLFDLLKQAVIGIIVGAVLGYLAHCYIAHDRCGLSLATYAPIVTLVAG